MQNVSCFKFMHKTTENFGIDLACIKYMYIQFWNSLFLGCYDTARHSLPSSMDDSCQYSEGRQAVVLQLDTKSYTGHQTSTYSLQRLKKIEMNTRFLNYKVRIV